MGNQNPYGTGGKTSYSGDVATDWANLLTPEERTAIEALPDPQVFFNSLRENHVVLSLIELANPSMRAKTSVCFKADEAKAGAIMPQNVSIATGRGG